MKRQTRRERLQALSQHQASPVQTRLQRLILDVQARAGLLGGESLDVPQYDRHAVDLGQFLDSRHDRAPKLRAEEFLVRHVRPVRRLPRGTNALVLTIAIALLLLSCAKRLGCPQPGHRGVERDAVNPGRKRGIAPEGADLPVDLHQHVLGDFLGVLPVLHLSQCKLVNP
jgi:hypothetical protein